MTEVIATDEWLTWYRSLDQNEAKAVAAVVDALEEAGVALRFPYSSAIKGSRYPLRELRIQVGGRPLRVVYVFDNDRSAVLLLGGDKTGDRRFYRRVVPIAEETWEQYRAEHRGKRSRAQEDA